MHCVKSMTTLLNTNGKSSFARVHASAGFCLDGHFHAG